MKPANVQKPRLLVIAGPNDAEKTTMTVRGLAHEWFAGCKYLFYLAFKDRPSCKHNSGNEVILTRFDRYALHPRYQ